MNKTEENLVTKYEGEILQEMVDEIRNLDKNTDDFKFTYNRRSGKYELVIRTTQV